MSNFKDFLTQDVKNTFFNENEFAQKLAVNGKEITIILDNEQLQQRQFGNGGEGLEKAEVLFSVAKVELDFRPRNGEIMQLGSKKYRVMNVSSDDDMYVITLGRNQ
ncbi:hypothetical protein [Bacillus sp. Au-Bac7]|uniref:hypothetical protein n=1 Tax=Bacillus sp. Au-Bac7 TaxID=2906458 RepID=UPI001E32181A|nr:hypothetical protein [Bacillus sp. Au-Bac7]MCE4048028.1 hypothetical protein [Bacillus sp. Au-Bac7]